MDHIRAARELMNLVNDILDYTEEEFESEMSRITNGATGTEYKGLINENDQLKAQIERLRGAIYDARIDWAVTPNGKLLSVLHETPAQSLAEIESSAITYALCMVYHEEDDHRGYYSYEGLRLHAKHIRQQALENKS